MNITKMRNQIRRVAPQLCGSILRHPDTPDEVCSLPYGHAPKPHDWPSLRTHESPPLLLGVPGKVVLDNIRRLTR